MPKFPKLPTAGLQLLLLVIVGAFLVFSSVYTIDPEEVDYLLNTGEEAVGDRYQRGGGSLSKAVGEVVGCVSATGADVKAFCSAPVHALITAGALVAWGYTATSWSSAAGRRPRWA